MTKRIIRSIIITLIVGFILYYLFLPPINLSSFSFYFFVLVLGVIFNGSLYFSVNEKETKKAINTFTPVTTVSIGIAAFAFIFIIGMNFILSPIFNSRKYANRIAINENTNFTEDINEVDFSRIPLLDKVSSQKLGDRVMGQLPELVSQFYVSNLYTQINYNDSIVRVTPLEYNGFIKYLSNNKEGIAGYITVNSVTGEAKLVKLENGIKYAESAYFFENVYRKLRFTYPTAIFGDINFEIDNEGNPYYIVPTIKYVGVGLRKDIKDVIILNAVSGESKRYELKDVPTWVDHVYNADIILEQVNDWGSYRNGFTNSIFGQKNVVATTEGYNYLTMNDDVYLYTGITSVSSDESNIGFILTNMRTKETNFYAVPGAEEYSAMASAEGQVQQMNYVSTFPLLINLNNRPTYLISLKDNAGLVKMYAFVDVADYQKVVVTDASKGIKEASRNYLANISTSYNTSSEATIKVVSITSSIINGNTYYYIIDTNNNKYRVSINVDEYYIPFITKGTQFTVTYIDGEVKEILNIKR